MSQMTSDQETRVERAWAAELRDRIRAVEAGEMQWIPEDQAQAEVDELLR